MSSHESLNLNEDVINSWESFFNEKARASGVFETTDEVMSFKSKFSASVIGNKWLQFSTLMPKLLCLLAAKVDSNQARMRILKIAWEELGEGNVNCIHPETFKNCLEVTDVQISNKYSPANNQLELYVAGDFKSTSEIFGLGLGLEIIAIRNIDTLYSGLSYDNIVASNLKNTEFFSIHFINEEFHIKHCIESFIKFCPDNKSKDDFIVGFENGLKFWKLFWNEVVDELKLNSLQSVLWVN